MPPNTLADRLAQRRMQVTGETSSRALPEVCRRFSKLTAHQRKLALTLLRNGGMEAELAQVHALAAALLPDAASQAQQELEAEIAWASNKAITYLHLRPEHGFLAPARVFQATTPHDDGSLQLKLCRDALPALLVELLPQEVDGEVHGAIGLRFRQRRRHVELYLADDPHARVLLAGVTAKMWGAALSFAEQAYVSTPQWTWNQGESLTRQEKRDLSRWPRTHGPIALTSAVLRRHHAFGAALWSKWWASGEHLSIEWPGGPDRDQTAFLLVDTLFGIAGCTVDSASSTYAIVDEPGPGDKSAALRSTTMPEQPDGDRELAELGRNSQHEPWRTYWAAAGEQR